MTDPLTYLCDIQRHLVCRPYSVENLHRMADDLGIKRCWFHAGRHPHYDIPKRRIVEVTARCTLVRPGEILATITGKENPLRGCPDLDPNWPGENGQPRGPRLCILYPNCRCGKAALA